MALCLHCFSHLKAPVMFSDSEDDNEELGTRIPYVCHVSRRASGVEQRRANGKRELRRTRFPMLVGERKAASQDRVTRQNLFPTVS